MFRVAESLGLTPVSLGSAGVKTMAVVTGQVDVYLHAGGQYEVTGGLSEGETVARGANFLVDSESRLKAAQSAMAPAGTTKAPPAPATDAPAAPPAAPAPPPAGHVH